MAIVLPGSFTKSVCKMWVKDSPFKAGMNSPPSLRHMLKRLFVQLLSFLAMPLNIWYNTGYENGDYGEAQTAYDP
jgi:hypothetical protein